ncbi:POZ-, AT hook-, and zinc finger-containing protein 1, partial [Eschrichtius robustus]|nr:POZ-, AT hook-, and zinc finger-containing protein 1 [Eschrichtius robustus]
MFHDLHGWAAMQARAGGEMLGVDPGLPSQGVVLTAAPGRWGESTACLEGHREDALHATKASEGGAWGLPGTTCNASFATRDRLRSHLACHEDKVPCQVCGKYLRAAYMADHLKKHSEGPSNFCSICNRASVEEAAPYMLKELGQLSGEREDASAWCACFGQVSRHQEPIPNGGAAFHCARTYGNKGKRPLALHFASLRRLCCGGAGPGVGRREGCWLAGRLKEARDLSGSGLQDKSHSGESHSRADGVELWLNAFFSFDHVGRGSQEGQKCSHQDPIESSDSYGDLSDASDLKTPEKQSTNGSFSCDMAVPKNKMESDGEKKYPCPECGSFFRSKSYLNKHIQKVHVRALGGPLGDLGPALGSPFSPQQNMSLLESFGFQIVQSAFASSLVDPEVDQQPMGPEGK